MDIADNPLADQLYRDVFFNSPLGLYTLDSDGVITSFNPKMAELSGDRPENAIGLNALHLESYQKAGLDKLFIKGIAGEPFETEVEYFSHLANKKSIRHYRGVPIADHGIVGQARLMLIVEDITERKTIEAQLKSFAQFTAENTNPLLRLNRDGLILLTNNVARSMVEALHPGQHTIAPDAFKVPVAESLSTGQPTTLDILYDEKTYLFEIFPVKGTDYVNVYGRDVTEERNTQKIKDHFLSVTSHELRTPMTVIRGYVELMLQGRTGELTENQKNYMQKILDNVKSLIEFVNVTLDMNKLESGEVELNLRSYDIKPSIQKVTESVSNLYLESGITLEYDQVSATAMIDPPQFERVITNLLSNALKFTEKGGHVKISTSHDTSTVTIAISDTGVGISEEDQKLLFQKYAQVNTKAFNEMKGTGLGLVISKDLVEKMNGKIWLQSKLDEGSTFYISLPLAHGV